MRKGMMILGIVAVVVLGAIFLKQWFYLRKAHSTFDNYYAFRGCAQLIEKTEVYDICKTSSGKTIKIVEYQGKWYLDGDLPWACIGKLCVGM